VSTPSLDEEAIFHAARAIADLYERQAFLQTACGDDTELLRRVQALLAVYDRPQKWLQTAAINLLETCVTSPAPLKTPPQIGPYQLLEKIGEGGMGVVYAAEQVEPIRRQVALKIIRPGMDSRQVLARFDAERQALAMMDHPNIARILDAGTIESGPGFRGSRPYFVMELVRGVPITEYCNQARLSPKRRLELFITVCQAVHHAHQKGIIHRDLKPSNVLVTQHDGEPVVKIIDFGVAKAMSGQLAQQTVDAAFDQLIGTPLYMSPEQAQAGGLDVDTRSDIYALGAMLYELLVGETVISRETIAANQFDELRRIIREVDPPRPSQRLQMLPDAQRSQVAKQRGMSERRLRDALRGELDCLVMKALDKNRQQRYATAGDFAADIKRYLTDVPVLASPARPWQRARKWLRRNPALASLGLTAVLLLLTATVGAWWHHHRLTKEYAISETLRRASLERERLLLREMRSNDIRMAWQAAMLGHNAEAQRLLHYNSSLEQDNPLGFAWEYLNGLTQEPVLTLTGHDADLCTGDISPDERWIASGDVSGEIKIWDAATGVEVHSLHYCDEEITHVRFSPDGRWLATTGVDRIVHIWQVGTWLEHARLEAHQRTVVQVAWSPDSKQLASVGRDQRIYIWDMEEKSVAEILPEQPDVVRAVAWSYDGKLLATANGDDGILIWNTKDWSLRGHCGGNTTRILAVAFSRDNRYVAYGGYGGFLSLADAQNQTEMTHLATEDNIWSLSFTSDDHLLIGYRRGRMHLRHFNSVTNEFNLIGEFRPNDSCQRAAVVTRSNRLLTVSEQDRTIGLRNCITAFGHEHHTHEDFIVGLLPQRGQFVTTNGSRTFVRNLADNSVAATLKIRASIRHCLALSPDSDLVAIPDRVRHVAVVDTRDWSIQHRLQAPTVPFSLAISEDSNWLYAGCMDGIVGRWNLQSGEWTLLEHSSGGSHGCVACSPTSDLVAYGARHDRGVEIWDATRQTRVASLPTTSEVNVLQFSPNGRWLVSGELAGYISVWDTRHFVKCATLTNGQAPVYLLAFTSSSDTLASCNENGVIQLWDLETRRELFPLARNQAQDADLAFTSDQQLVVVGHSGLEMLIFHARPESK
jgi:WD40 repeat protein/serine/threonine protein kinase